MDIVSANPVHSDFILVVQDFESVYLISYLPLKSMHIYRTKPPRSSRTVFLLLGRLKCNRNLHRDCRSKHCLLLQEFTSTTWVGRSTPSAWVTVASLCKVGTAITTTAFTPQQSARSQVGVAWKFSTTRSLLSSWHSQWTMALRRSMSLQKCAPSAWALWRWVGCDVACSAVSHPLSPFPIPSYCISKDHSYPGDTLLSRGWQFFRDSIVLNTHCGRIW